MRGLHVNRFETKYLWCNFSNEPNEEGIEVRVGDQLLYSKDNFRYLGSYYSIKVLCYKKLPLKLKGIFYRVPIRPILLYRVECWGNK